MTTLLHIDASPRFEGSHSRALADHLVAEWLGAREDGRVVKRDLALTPPPHVDAAATAAFTTAPADRGPTLDAAAARSDALIEEFLAADEVLISAPMHNFGPPSSLKAYVDHIVRAGHTFSYDPDTGFDGLVKTKRAYLALAYGAAGYVGGPMASLDFLAPYLESVLRFIGVPRIEMVYVEGTAFDPAAAQRSMAAAAARIGEVVAP